LGSISSTKKEKEGGKEGRKRGRKRKKGDCQGSGNQWEEDGKKRGYKG
jgi:hypothetical protein